MQALSLISGYGHWHLSQVQSVHFPVSKSYSQQRLAADAPPIIDFCSSLPNFCAFKSTAFFVFMMFWCLIVNVLCFNFYRNYITKVGILIKTFYILSKNNS
mgnify:CR=1 FL=1